MADRLGLSSPWITYFKKIEALFEKDPEVAVDFDDETYTLKIYVDDQGKAEAIDALLPDALDFGKEFNFVGALSPLLQKLRLALPRHDIFVRVREEIIRLLVRQDIIRQRQRAVLFRSVAQSARSAVL